MASEASPLSDVRVLGKRLLVKERDHYNYKVGELEVIRTKPDVLVSAVVIGKADRCPLDVSPGDVVWFRRNCGREVPGYDDHLFLEPHMVDLAGDGELRSY